MPFVGHLETGHRRPSEKTIAQLAKVLGLDQQELFLLANPGTRAFFRSHSQDSTGSAWDQFKRNRQLHRTHMISLTEMSILERAAFLGEAESPDVVESLGLGQFVTSSASRRRWSACASGSSASPASPSSYVVRSSREISAANLNPEFAPTSTLAISSPMESLARMREQEGNIGKSFRILKLEGPASVGERPELACALEYRRPYGTPGPTPPRSVVPPRSAKLPGAPVFRSGPGYRVLTCTVMLIDLNTSRPWSRNLSAYANCLSHATIARQTTQFFKACHWIDFSVMTGMPAPSE